VGVVWWRVGVGGGGCGGCGGCRGGGGDMCCSGVVVQLWCNSIGRGNYGADAEWVGSAWAVRRHQFLHVFIFACSYAAS
jgi:hypothetical protein